MDFVALAAWLPKWMDPQRSPAPAQFAYTALVLLVFAVVYLDHWIVNWWHHRRNRHADGASGPSNP